MLSAQRSASGREPFYGQVYRSYELECRMQSDTGMHLPSGSSNQNAETFDRALVVLNVLQLDSTRPKYLESYLLWKRFGSI